MSVCVSVCNKAISKLSFVYTYSVSYSVLIYKTNRGAVAARSKEYGLQFDSASKATFSRAKGARTMSRLGVLALLVLAALASRVGAICTCGAPSGGVVATTGWPAKEEDDCDTPSKRGRNGERRDAGSRSRRHRSSTTER